MRTIALCKSVFTLLYRFQLPKKHSQKHHSPPSENSNAIAPLAKSPSSPLQALNGLIPTWEANATPRKGTKPRAGQPFPPPTTPEVEVNTTTARLIYWLTISKQEKWTHHTSKRPSEHRNKPTSRWEAQSPSAPLDRRQIRYDTHAVCFVPIEPSSRSPTPWKSQLQRRENQSLKFFLVETSIRGQEPRTIGCSHQPQSAGTGPSVYWVSVTQRLAKVKTAYYEHKSMWASFKV